MSGAIPENVTQVAGPRKLIAKMIVFLTLLTALQFVVVIGYI